MSAVPAKSFESTSPPLLTNSRAETRGNCDRSTTTTRKPFASVFSTGFGN
jgi:hypothetical protein